MNNRIIHYRKALPVFALLLGILLVLQIIGCDTVFTPPRSTVPAAPKTGMGTFSLRIEGANPQARIIAPTAPSFAGYTVVFSEAVSPFAVLKTFDYISSGASGDPIAIEAGTYNIKVIGYSSYTDETDNVPVAEGTATSVIIPDGGAATITITLKAIDSGSVDGTFSWDVSFENLLNLTTAEMTIAKQDGSITPITKALIGGSAENPGSLPLPPGHYFVEFTLESANSKTITWIESLHIFQNLESIFDNGFSDLIFTKASYVLTIYSEGAIYSSQTCFYDDDFPKPPAPSGKMFGGWYTDASFGTPYNSSTLSSNTTLYAKWVDNPLSASVVSFTIRNGLPVAQQITLENSESTDITNLSISIDEGPPTLLTQTASLSSTTILGMTDLSYMPATFSVQPTSDALSLSLGTHNVTITITFDFAGETDNELIITVPIILPKYSGSESVTAAFNSMGLLKYSPAGAQGWYLRDILGTWVQGEIIQAQTPLVIQSTDPFASWSQQTDVKVNAGSVGSFRLVRIGGGGSRDYTLTVDIAIPYDEVEMVITAQSGLTPFDLTYTNTTGLPQFNQRLTIKGTSTSNFTLIDDYSGTPTTYSYITIAPSTAQLAFSLNFPNTYLEYDFIPSGSGSGSWVFKQDGVNIYYWGDSTVGKATLNQLPVHGHWSSGDINFYEFDYIAKPTQTYTNPIGGAVTTMERIIVNTIPTTSFDPLQTDVRFVANASAVQPGPDIQFPTSGTPSLVTGGTQDIELYIQGEHVGTATVELTGGSSISSPTYVPATVNFSVVYTLDSAFEPFVATIECNGQTATLNGGTGKWDGPSFTGVTPGYFYLTTDFTFN